MGITHDQMQTIARKIMAVDAGRKEECRHGIGLQQDIYNALVTAYNRGAYEASRDEDDQHPLAGSERFYE